MTQAAKVMSEEQFDVKTSDTSDHLLSEEIKGESRVNFLCALVLKYSGCSG